MSEEKNRRQEGAGARVTEEEVSRDEISFSFGENWLDYSANLSEEQIAEAVRDLRKLLTLDDLQGKTFLDVGAGSGVHSVAAMMLGAERIVSVDRDENSIASCERLKERNNLDRWEIRSGSILDPEFVESLGRHDVVYSWGVLHHTGAMWQAIENASTLVNDDGLFAIAIYNKRFTSNFWLWYKQLYNRGGALTKKLMTWYLFLPRAVVRALRLKHPLRDVRGMSIYYDAVDWAGGLPYEFATFDEIRDDLEKKGFELINSTRTTQIGCNEFVFRKKSAQ